MKNFYRRSLVLIMFLILLAALVFLSMSQAKAVTAKFYKSAFQQEVTGQVIGPKGDPLLGVTVIVKNRQYGTTTNKDGIYKLKATPSDTLVFSSIGFKKLEVPLQGRTNLDVQLQEDIASLGEVEINAGYYNVTERERTGNISRVTAEEIENQPVVSPLQALQGRMPGVEVVSGGNHPGMASTIRIRGVNSLREEGNYPLYIIDGVPVNSTPIESNTLLGSAGIDPLNNLAISNIESIEVLKDADATAIYGSRGANGVVLITTKKGKKGSGLEANIYMGASKVPDRLDLLNTREYLQIRRKAFENDGVEPTRYNAYDLVLWDQDRYTDWQDYLFGGTAETANASLNFSGGSENNTFRLGGTYFTQGTIYLGKYNYNKITGNANFNHRSQDEKFNLSYTLNYGVDVNNLVGNLKLSSAAITIPPNAPDIFNDDGSLNWEDWTDAGLTNPFEGYYNNSKTQTNNLISNVGISYEFIQGLEVKANLGYTYYNSEELWKLPSKSYRPGYSFGNMSIHLDSKRKSWLIEPQLVYDKKFNKFNLNFILGATLQENTFNKIGLQGKGYASENLIGNLAAAEDIINAKSENTDYKYSALFSRVGLNWDRKYFLNLTGRRDGSSRFGPNNRFASFGAIGTAWIFSEEPFFKSSLPFLSFGKLRGSYGTTGNDQIGDYGYLDAYEATIGTGGLYPTILANPDYSWEINKKLEGGLDLGFIDNKIKFGVSWYRNRSSNQLVGYPLPAITGFTSVQANLPATVENRGWEIDFSSLNINTKKFNWQTSFNISIPKNELISYPGIEESSYANTYRVGSPLNISLLYQYNGLDPETGFYTVKDINEDGLFNYEDRVIIQDQTRSFYGGISNDFKYSNFSFQFLWQFVKHQGKNPLFHAGITGNQIDDVLKSLEENSGYQRLSQSYPSIKAFNYVKDSSFPLEDASFLRLKTLSISYNLPETLLQKLGMKNLLVFIHGQNLLTITPYSGLDPEFPNSGIGFGGLKTITGGLQIKL